MATVTFTTLQSPSGTSATEIKAIEVDDGVGDTFFFTGPPDNLVISNADASGDSCTFDLFFTDGTDTHYILRSTEVPAGAALVLEGLEIEYDTTTYALKAQLDSVAATQILTIKATYE
jgi:hypothetical protein